MKLCFLFEERFFSLIVDLNETTLAAFITRLVRHLEKTKLNSETSMYCSPEYSKFFGTPCISQRIYSERYVQWKEKTKWKIFIYILWKIRSVERENEMKNLLWLLLFCFHSPNFICAFQIRCYFESDWFILLVHKHINLCLTENFST